MTMAFEPEIPEILQLVSNLEGAAARGAHVTLSVDARAFLANHGAPGPLWFHNQLPQQLRSPYALKRQILERFNSYPNCRAVILNQPDHAFSLPVAGRSHIKTAIIDEYVFIGGCNLDEPAHFDLMIGWPDKRVAQDVYTMMRKITDHGHARKALGGRDHTIIVSHDARLLIDSGVRDQSLIFTEALKLIDSSKEWLTLSCQFFPNSITARHLLQAKQRGVKLDIIYSDPAHHGLIGGNGQRYSIFRERRRLPADMFAHKLSKDIPMIHAKLLACDQGMLLGSHNYVRAGVRLGTAEIALITKDVELTKQAVRLLNQQLT